MRARMAIRYCNIQVELREVSLKNKPESMLAASAKATVPVLINSDGTVIDESLEIMLWALQQHPLQNWLLPQQQDEIFSLIRQNDNLFKIHLDHYKYASRFPDKPAAYYRQQGEQHLLQLENRLQHTPYLFNQQPSLADIALFPFIRQFAYVDLDWFKTSPYPQLRQWLTNWLESELFLSIMKKSPDWEEHHSPVLL